GDARQSVERVACALVVQHVVEEGAETRTRQFSGRVGDGLHQLVQIEFSREHPAQLVDRLRLLARLLLKLKQALTLGRRAPSLRYVARYLRRPYDTAIGIKYGRHGEGDINERSIFAHPHRLVVFDALATSDARQDGRL